MDVSNVSKSAAFFHFEILLPVWVLNIDGNNEVEKSRNDAVVIHPNTSDRLTGCCIILGLLIIIIIKVIIVIVITSISCLPCLHELIVVSGDEHFDFVTIWEFINNVF